jgi:hypothetical protein
VERNDILVRGAQPEVLILQTMSAAYGKLSVTSQHRPGDCLA